MTRHAGIPRWERLTDWINTYDVEFFLTTVLIIAVLTMWGL